LKFLEGFDMNTAPLTSPTSSRKLNGKNLLTIISVGILVGTELFGVALASGWAIAGLFELGMNVGYGLMGVFSLMAAYGLYHFVKAAAIHEPIWR
jgi:hypothetical protein